MEGVTQQAWIDLSFANGVWKVPAGDLEAALSLSTYKNEVEKEKQKSGQQRKDAENVEDENDGRERHEPSPKDPELRLDEANRTKDHVIRDLNTWAPHDHHPQMALKETQQGLGAFHARDPGRHGPNTQMLGSDLLDVDIYATRLLFSFIWSMAKALKGKGKDRWDICDDGCRDPGSNYPLRIMSLWNTELTQLATTLAPASYLPEKTTIVEIISALSVTGKLPIPKPWFDCMSAMVRDGYGSGNLNALKKPRDLVMHLARAYGN